METIICRVYIGVILGVKLLFRVEGFRGLG